MRRSLGILAAAATAFLVGAILVVRFFYYFLREPTRSGHIQSLTIGVASVIVAVLVCAMAVLADLLSVNRRLLEEVRDRVERLQTGAKERSASSREALDNANQGGSGLARDSDASAGRLLRGPGHTDARARDAADRKVR
jgi:hypothetical protein